MFQAAAWARSANFSLKVRQSAAQQVMLAEICCLPCEAVRCAPAAQTPTWTSGIELQRKLHRPQLLASVCRSTHTPLQHVWLLSHSFPQDPQLHMFSPSRSQSTEKCTSCQCSVPHYLPTLPFHSLRRCK